MEEVMKMLGPWPVLQMMFGVAVLGGGVWAIIKGQKKNDAPTPVEDRRAEWEAYRQLENIEGEAFKQTEILSKILDRLDNNARSMNALMAELWNQRQGFPPRPPTP